MVETTRKGVVAAIIASPLIVFGAVILLGIMAFLTDMQPASGSQAPVSATNGGDLRGDIPQIPAEYYPMIRGAVANANCPTLTESVLAAQLFQESGFNPQAGSRVGAQGIAQFMPGTWPSWGRDENGNGIASPWEPEDAIPAAARFDCALAKRFDDIDIPGDLAELMLAGYNAGPGAVEQYRNVPPYLETQTYVRRILTLARQWSNQSAVVSLTGSDVAAAAVEWAVAQVGGDYSFGGDCTDPLGTNKDQQCDCSSLVQQAYAHAGVSLPRVTTEQINVGTSVPIDQVVPGDLLFLAGALGTPTQPRHVMMYVGEGKIVEAQQDGVPIHVVAMPPVSSIVAVRRIVPVSSQVAA